MAIAERGSFVSTDSVGLSVANALVDSVAASNEAPISDQVDFIRKVTKK